MPVLVLALVGGRIGRDFDCRGVVAQGPDRYVAREFLSYEYKKVGWAGPLVFGTYYCPSDFLGSLLEALLSKRLLRENSSYSSVFHLVRIGMVSLVGIYDRSE